MNLNKPLSKARFLDVSAPNKSDFLIGGKSSGIVNWNDIKYTQFYEIYKNLVSNFWRPEEIPMIDDAKQWKTLSELEQKSFLNIIGLLSILDSVQPNYLSVLKDYLSDSSARMVLSVIEDQEVIHNQSYSYVLSSIEKLESQNKAFDMARTRKEIYERNSLIIDIYEEFKNNPTPINLCNSIAASIVLEGINFYSSFAFFYNLARNQKMVKTSTMISYINKDEFAHSYFMSLLLKLIISEYPEINKDGVFEVYVQNLFKRAVELETEWSRFVLNGIDVDIDEMSEYIEYRANKCLGMLNFSPVYDGVSENSMPWIRVFSDENLNLGKTDFFENKSRQYSKTSDNNGFDEL
ncbi:ribonucleotide-diphosphate reductase subunit beta [Paenibacillaceae bacterium]|nr:ribonucleotide-diphosphate reductase subunit beta [Paenibacillaceae bacterium]